MRCSDSLSEMPSAGRPCITGADSCRPGRVESGGKWTPNGRKLGVLRIPVPFSLNQPRTAFDPCPTDDTEWAAWTMQGLLDHGCRVDRAVDHRGLVIACTGLRAGLGQHTYGSGQSPTGGPPPAERIGQPALFRRRSGSPRRPGRYRLRRTPGRSGVGSGDRCCRDEQRRGDLGRVRGGRLRECCLCGRQQY